MASAVVVIIILLQFRAHLVTRRHESIAPQSSLAKLPNSTLLNIFGVHGWRRSSAAHSISIQFGIIIQLRTSLRHVQYRRLKLENNNLPPRKVSFDIASEASYVYILSGQKLIKNAKNSPFWRIFENLKLTVRQCYQTGHF